MLCQSEGSRRETPCSGQTPWATKELAHIGDLQEATQHMAEHPWRRRFPDGFGVGRMCVAGALVQGTGQLQGTVFCELGAGLEVDAHFLPTPRCWGRKGVLAMWGGAGHTSPCDRNGEAMQGCSSAGIHSGMARSCPGVC